MRQRFTWLCVALLLAAGCDRGERPAPVEPPKTPPKATAPEAGGTLMRWLETDVATLNPILLTTDYERQVLSYVFEPLLDIDDRMNLVPALATRWEISPDGRTYTFHLDPHATFSDGVPVRSTDVLFTLKTIVDPKTESHLASLFEGFQLEESSAENPGVVKVAFASARASQLLAFNVPILPEHVYSRGEFLKDFNESAVGSGPYRIDSRERGSQIVLVQRKDYWRRKPWIERIVFRVIGDATVAWNALLRGEIDELLLTSDQWKLSMDDPEAAKVIDIRRFYDLSYNFVPWNTRDPILRDKRVRRALAMCLDRPSLITNLHHGTSRVITGPFTPDQWAYNPNVAPIEFDLEGAGRILESAGWKDTNGDGVRDRNGKKLTIEMLLPAGNKTSADLAQIFQDSLAKAGVRLTIRPVDRTTYFGRITEGKFQASMLAWSLDLDPDPYSYFHSSQFPPIGQNFGFYSNPEADKLMTEGREELDPAKRTAIYHRLHEILADDQPYMWTFQVSRKWAVNRRIRNVREAQGLGLFLWYPGPFEWWIPSAERRGP